MANIKNLKSFIAQKIIDKDTTLRAKFKEKRAKQRERVEKTERNITESSQR